MTTTPRFRAPRAPYTGLREGFEALMRKKDAALSSGAYARDPRPGVRSVVSAAHRSRFAVDADGATPGDGQLAWAWSRPAWPPSPDRSASSRGASTALPAAPPSKASARVIPNQWC